MESESDGVDGARGNVVQSYRTANCFRAARLRCITVRTPSTKIFTGSLSVLPQLRHEGHLALTLAIPPSDSRWNYFAGRGQMRTRFPERPGLESEGSKFLFVYALGGS